MRASRGLALILALALSAVLSLLALQFGWATKSQTARAMSIADRIDAELQLRSDQSTLLFRLMTRPWVIDSGDQLVPKIDDEIFFDGQAFRLGGTTFCIQDLTGLLPFPGRKDPSDELRRLLERRLGSPEMSRSVVANLHHYYETGGVRSVLQSLRALAVIGDVAPADIDWLERYVTLYPVTDFNPLTAPEVVLQVRIPRYASEVMSLRRTRELNRKSFKSLAPDFPGDFVRFYPGPGLRIDSVTPRRDVILKRRQELTLLPGAGLPIAAWSTSQTLADTECQL